MSEPKINAIAPWYGSNRTLAENVGKALGAVGWVGIPFAGSMTEIRFIRARTLMVNDKHRALINLAQVMGCREKGPQLYRRLRRRLFHPQELAGAQGICKLPDLRCVAPSVDWAEAYFVAVWMGRSACAGTKSELDGGLAVRWNAGGGDSAVRFQNAVASLPAWRRLMRRCTFSCLDAFDFLMKCKDTCDTGIYCDPPFPGPGDKYLHEFDEDQHRRLARDLTLFDHARIVCRFYEHPLMTELYRSEQGWNWTVVVGGRDQRNAKNKPEILIVRN